MLIVNFGKFQSYKFKSWQICKKEDICGFKTYKGKFVNQ